MRQIGSLDDRDFCDSLTPSQFNAALKAQRSYNERFSSGYNGPRNAFWITGKPGVGKSRYVKSFGPYIKPCSKWWDGYCG